MGQNLPISTIFLRNNFFVNLMTINITVVHKQYNHPAFLLALMASNSRAYTDWNIVIAISKEKIANKVLGVCDYPYLYKKIISCNCLQQTTAHSYLYNIISNDMDSRTVLSALWYLHDWCIHRHADSDRNLQGLTVVRQC